MEDEAFIAELIFHVAENIKSLIDAKGIELRLSLPELAVYIEGDYLALELMLRNLLENALKFMEQGFVSIRLLPYKNQTQVKIEDSGSGKPEEALTKLFDRFYQSSVKQRQKGTDLGLSLVKSIIT